MQLGHLFEIMKTDRKWPIPVLLIKAGFYEIAIGSIIGVLGGWILYNELLHFMVTKQIRKTKVLSKKTAARIKAISCCRSIKISRLLVLIPTCDSPPQETFYRDGAFIGLGDLTVNKRAKPHFILHKKGSVMMPHCGYQAGFVCLVMQGFWLRPGRQQRPKVPRL